MKIQPARRLRGRVPGLPGDKSITHRAAIISALAAGQTRISNFSTSQDCTSTLESLRQLGVSIERDGSTVIVDGVGQGSAGLPPSFRAAHEALDCGNSGSTIRMLAGVLAGQPFTSVLTGDDSLRSRPMKRIIAPLEMMGAHLTSEDGRAPLRIEGRHPLTSIRYEMPIASAQVKSCVLLAGLHAEGRTAVIERGIVTRDHTERMLNWFSVNVETTDVGVLPDTETAPSFTHLPQKLQDILAISVSPDREAEQSFTVSVDGGGTLTARDIIVPGDISSSAFLVVAAALLPGSRLQIDGVGLNPTRAQLIPTLFSLGVSITTGLLREQCNESVGSIIVNGGEGIVPSVEGRNILRGSLIAGLIDELPVLAVLGTQVEGGLIIRDAKELRVKESDRITTTVENLRAMGAEVEEYDDGLAVGGPVRLRGAHLRAHGDHRIAMAFTVAALAAEGESYLEGAECVGVSFPEFFQLLDLVTER
ncbi:MAG: 3-phosphoshikimate 1-carboxyvinyltransferase [Acidobacteriota bacterium]|nr:3-phosphoshikimate 1-carboxyvinyltransferase [Acidobacteriota bacterium]